MNHFAIPSHPKGTDSLQKPGEPEPAPGMARVCAVPAKIYIYPFVLSLTELLQTGLDKLPPELLYMIGQQLGSQQSISRLSRTNRYLDTLLTPYLLHYNAKRKGKRGKSALSWAAAHGHEKVVRAALATYPTLLAKKPLLVASRNGYAGIVQLLLEKNGVDIESRDAWGHTPLTIAVENGHEKVVKLLLDAGADPTARPGVLGPHAFVVLQRLPDSLLSVAARQVAPRHRKSVSTLE
jgi:hypothetical protein